MFQEEWQEPIYVVSGVNAFVKAIIGDGTMKGNLRQAGQKWEYIGWLPPPLNWVKINTDGSVKGNSFKGIIWWNL